MVVLHWVNKETQLKIFCDFLLESLPSCRITSREIIEVDSGFPVFSTIKEEDMITSLLNRQKREAR
jgi:hypothetical protein